MLDELVQSTLQKGTTVYCLERRVLWEVGPTQIVEVNIDDINDNNDYMIDSISGDLKDEIIETDTTERLAQEDYKELMAPPEKDMDQLKEAQAFHKEVPDAWSEEDIEKKKDIEQLEVRHQEKLEKFENKLKQIHALKSKSISPGEAWILCREESSILAQFHQPEEMQKAVQFVMKMSHQRRPKCMTSRTSPTIILKYMMIRKMTLKGRPSKSLESRQ